MRFGRAGEQSGRAGSRCRLRGRRFKWNLFDARPLFHLSRRPTRRRRASIGFAFAKSVVQRIGNNAANRVRSRCVGVVGRRVPGKPGFEALRGSAWRRWLAAALASRSRPTPALGAVRAVFAAAKQPRSQSRTRPTPGETDQAAAPSWASSASMTRAM